MFKNLFNYFIEKYIEREQIAFDKDQKAKGNNLYGTWEKGRRVYENGCYSIPKAKENGEWICTLYSENGKVLGDYDMTDIVDWHHGFVLADRSYCINMFFDRWGNCLFCDGIFIALGDNMYLVPTKNEYLLYNHKVGKVVVDETDRVIRFDGVNEENGVIIGETETEESSGYGTLNIKTKYAITYKIDMNGNILSVEKTIKK